MVLFVPSRQELPIRSFSEKNNNNNTLFPGFTHGMCTKVLSSLHRNYSTGRGSPYMGKKFQVRDVRRWTAHMRGRKDEES